MNNNDKITVATLLKADTRTPAGYVYPRAVVEKMIEQFNAMHTCVGDLNPEVNELTVNMANASHVVERLFLTEDGDLNAQIKFLDTPKGQLLVELYGDQKVMFTPVSVAGINPDDMSVKDNVSFVKVSAYGVKGRPL